MSFEMVNEMLGSLDQKEAIRFLLQKLLGINLENPLRMSERFYASSHIQMTVNLQLGEF